MGATKKNELETVSEKQLTATETKEINAYLDSLGSTLNDFHKMQFISICRMLQLNPLKREIYGIPYNSGGKVTFSIVVGYEVYLKRAESTGLLKGWKVWTEGEGSFLKACVQIKRSDWEEVFVHEVYWDEYVQTKWDKNGKRVPTKFWAEKPRTMLKKVAIAQGMRLCFNDACSGIPYVKEETDAEFSEPEPREKMKDSPFAGAVYAEIIEPEQLPPPQEPECYVPEHVEYERQAGEDIEEDSTPAPVPVPAPEQSITIAEMRTAVLAKFKPFSQKADLFFSKKAWIAEGESLPSLSDNQIKRLYKNIESIFDMFGKWQVEQTAESKK